jgi:hypothetical protein
MSSLNPKMILGKSPAGARRERTRDGRQHIYMYEINRDGKPPPETNEFGPVSFFHDNDLRRIRTGSQGPDNYSYPGLD